MKNLLIILISVFVSGCSSYTALKKYSQATPEESLSSLLTASKSQDVAYLQKQVHYSSEMWKLIDDTEAYKNYDTPEINKLIEDVFCWDNKDLGSQDKPCDLIWFLDNPDELEKLKNGTTEEAFPVELGKHNKMPVARISNQPAAKIALDFFEYKNEWYYLVGWFE